MINELSAKSCGNCQFYQKVGKRSGKCILTIMTVRNQITKEDAHRYTTVMKYDICDNYMKKKGNNPQQS